MTTSTLTDRYVHASTRYLSASRRDDIARELAASIDDMIGARIEAGEDRDAAERKVLTDLGNPDLLATQYAQKPVHLIGPRFFPIYLRLTVVLLSFVPALVGVIAGLAEFADDASAGRAVAEGIGTAFMVAIHVCFWSTLTFALIERYGSEDHLPEWTVDKLPELSIDRRVTLADTILSIAFIGSFIAILVVQHFRSWVDDGSGDDVPVLNPDLWSFWLPALITVLVASIAVEVWKYRIGRITWPVVGGVTVTSLLWLVPVVGLAAEDKLMSRPFVEALDLSANHVDLINTLFIVVAIGIEAMTIGDAAWKARRRPA